MKVEMVLISPPPFFLGLFAWHGNIHWCNVKFYPPFAITGRGWDLGALWSHLEPRRDDKQFVTHGQGRRLGLDADGGTAIALAADSAHAALARRRGAIGPEFFFRRHRGADAGFAGAHRPIAAVGAPVGKCKPLGRRTAGLAGMRGMRVGIQLLAGGNRRHRRNAGLADSGSVTLAVARISRPPGSPLD